METKSVYFEKPGNENTGETLRIAKQRADELGIKTVIVASTEGGTGARAVDVFKGMKVIVVSHSFGFRDPNASRLTAENRKIIESKGGIVLIGTHAFAGVSRALRNKTNTTTIGDIIAETLRVIGQGMKVVCEIATMAADAGLVRTDEEVIVVSGSSKGADTAAVVKPANSHLFFDLKVKEILCKPR